MDFLKEQQIRFFTGDKYKNIYDLFAKEYNIKYARLFTICACIGFKNNCLEDVISGEGYEFRSAYLTTEESANLYTILILDPELGHQIEKFSDKSFVSQCQKKLERYAAGGMRLLVNEVFKTHWNGFSLDNNYEEYDVDIMVYINEEINKAPF